MKSKFLFVFLVMLLALPILVSAESLNVDKVYISYRGEEDLKFANTLEKKLNTMMDSKDMKHLKDYFDVGVIIHPKGYKLNEDAAWGLITTGGVGGGTITYNELKSSYYVFVVLQEDRRPYVITNAPLYTDFLTNIVDDLWEWATGDKYIESVVTQVKAIMLASGSCGVGGKEFKKRGEDRNLIFKLWNINREIIICDNEDFNYVLNSLGDAEKMDVNEFTSDFMKIPFTNVLYYYTGNNEEWDEVIVISSNKERNWVFKDTEEKDFRKSFVPFLWDSKLLFIFSKKGDPIKLIRISDDGADVGDVLNELFLTVDHDVSKASDLTTEINENLKGVFGEKGVDWFVSTNPGNLKGFKKFFDIVSTQKLRDYAGLFSKAAKNGKVNRVVALTKPFNINGYQINEFRSILVTDDILLMGLEASFWDGDSAGRDVRPVIMIDSLSKFKSDKPEHYDKLLKPHILDKMKLSKPIIVGGVDCSVYSDDEAGCKSKSGDCEPIYSGALYVGCGWK